MSCSRTIDGNRHDERLPNDRHSGVSAVAMGSARPASIRTTARRSLTSCSGSKVAFRRRTRPTVKTTFPRVDESTTARRRPRLRRSKRRPTSPFTVDHAKVPVGRVGQRQEGRVGATSRCVEVASPRAPTHGMSRGMAKQVATESRRPKSDSRVVRATPRSAAPEQSVRRCRDPSGASQGPASSAIVAIRSRRLVRGLEEFITEAQAPPIRRRNSD